MANGWKYAGYRGISFQMALWMTHRSTTSQSTTTENNHIHNNSLKLILNLTYASSHQPSVIHYSSVTMSLPVVVQARPYVQTPYNPSRIFHGPKFRIPKSLQVPSKRSFTSFTQLPSEIREQIWVFALIMDNPRVIELGVYFREWHEHAPRTARYPSKTVVPALLHVCAEARAIALQYYEPFSVDGTWTGTYIDWSLDYVYLNWSIETWNDINRPYQGVMSSVLTNACQHLVVGRELYEAAREQIHGTFPNTSDIAVLCGLKLQDYDTAAKKDSEDDYEGGEIRLFDISEGLFGPIAVPVERFRGKRAHDQESTRATIQPDISNIWYHGSWTHMWDSDHYRSRVTVLLGYQRKQPVSQEELQQRKSTERKLIDEHPPHISFDVYNKNTTIKEMRAEAIRRGLEPTGKRIWLASRLYDHEWRAKAAWHQFQRELPHRSREIRYNSKPGKQITLLTDSYQILRKTPSRGGRLHITIMVHLR
jgi:hypothetical protein